MTTPTIRNWSLCIALCFSSLIVWGSDKPNLIFFLSDDHRWDRMGNAGHPYLQTPTMDALAEKGTRFSNAMVTTSICAASRATLFTGLYERTHGFTFGTAPIRQTDLERSYPALLKNSGYRTGFVGKFGVSTPRGAAQELMFDVYQPLNRSPYIKTLSDGSQRHVSEIAGDRAIEFLDSQPKEQPFCLSISFNAAHAEDGDKRPAIGHYPWPEAVDGLYEDIPVTAPRLSDPAIYDAHPQFMKDSMNRARYFWRWDTDEKYRANLRAYYRMITGLDRVMGRVLERLETLGMSDNTVVVFSGDNGYYEGQRGFAGKWSHYEESLRVPLIVYDPRVPESQRGQVIDALSLNVDVAPTLLSYAGVAIPDRYQGRSLRSWVEGNHPSSWRTDSFAEHLMNNAQIPKWEGVRGQRFVYARYFEQDPPYEYLHDLRVDPDQLTNYVDHPDYVDTLEQMRARCDQLRDQYGGPYSLEAVLERKRRAAEAR